METIKFKKGDMVYYNRYERGSKNLYFDTIPCEVITVNKKTLKLSDGDRTYNRVSPDNCYLQSIN